jgi:putative phosphoribosyl transferase
MSTLEHPIRIEVRDAVAGVGSIEGTLRLPSDARGVVIFAHGTGSSRRSPRNRMVASHLNDARFATVLFDLLTAGEEAVDVRTRQLRFDIGLLARRVLAAADSVTARPDLSDLPLGMFGASTGAAAALVAAAERPAAIGAIVSRGGRPDLACDALPLVRAPTLLIVGSRDHQVLEMNREAAAHLAAAWTMEVVPGASHLFEEPGALEEVAALATGWFERHLPAGSPDD